MRLTNRFLDNAFAAYDTDIELKNFRVVEAPRALRLFSVLSPVGLYALVEGDGTNFRVGEARLETRGNIVNIKRISGLGDAIGVSILGIYDRSNRTIDLSGNLVPARFVGRFLGNLPVLGELIAGVDKNGIFVTEFKMSGALDKPTTKVNPVTSLAPGVIRDILSPNWIGKEQERLFGKSPDQSSPDQ
ncbi:MAG: AsmA-like C-terminal domain-containing protein [Candidatus Puniceispirillum sp.]